MSAQTRQSFSLGAQNTFSDVATIGTNGYVYVFISGATSNAKAVIQIYDPHSASWDTLLDYVDGDSTTGKYQKDVTIRLPGAPGVQVRVGILTGDYSSGTVTGKIRDA